jgi:uncharacterized protein YhbP (UPF0306 family)
VAGAGELWLMTSAAGMSTAVRVAAFLDAHHVASLATCGMHGPHAANVFYVREQFALLWVSDPRSRHSVDLEAEPRIAATIAPDCFDMDEIRGVQISGNAHVITNESRRVRARLLLEARYPCVKRLHGASSMKDAYTDMEFYRLEAMRIVLIDNSRGFAHKETLKLEAIADTAYEQVVENIEEDIHGG